MLNRKNEELLVIFSNADLDHTSTIDKVEFALSLRSMGVRHVASIFEIMPVFGYTNGSSDVDLYELLLKAKLTRRSYRHELTQWREAHSRAARASWFAWPKALWSALKAQLWNTLTLPHYDNGRERFVVSEPVGLTNVTSQAEKAFIEMEMLGYQVDTKRHHFEDKALPHGRSPPPPPPAPPQGAPGGSGRRRALPVGGVHSRFHNQ